MNPQIVELIHALFCISKHTHNPEDLLGPKKSELCYFYLESQVDDENGMEDHIKWEAFTENIMLELELNESQMINFISDLGNLIGKWSLFVSIYPKSKVILKMVLKL